MSWSPKAPRPGRRASRRERRRGRRLRSFVSRIARTVRHVLAPARLPFVGLLVVTAAVSVLVVPELAVDGSPRDLRAFDFDPGADPPRTTRTGTISSNENGYVIDGQAAGQTAFPLRARYRRGRRTIVRIWAYGPRPLEVEVAVSGGGGRPRSLGRPDQWIGKVFDVTEEARAGRLRMQVTVTNPTKTPTLFLDRLVVAEAPERAVSSVGALPMSSWIVLLLATAMAAGHLLRRHWPLLVGAGIGMYVFWSEIRDVSLTSLEGQASALWPASTGADWLDLETGLLSGSFGGLSSLTVQLFHSLSALLGEGAVGARGASALIAIASLAAIYALGNRVAGRWAGAIALSIALLADPFREAAVSGAATTTLILAAALLAYATHACLAEASRQAIAILGLAGGLAVLANPLWLPGVVAAVALLALRYAPPGERRRILGIGLLVLFVFLLPNRLSTAEQAEGDVLADVRERATAAATLEFNGARQTDELLPLEDLSLETFQRKPIGLFEYLFSEHSVSVVIGGTLSGANDVLDSFTVREESRLAGLIAVALALLGALYALALARLRMLVIVPLIIALPELFFVSRGASIPFAGGAIVWPAFVASGGLLAFVLGKAYVEPRLGPMRDRLAERLYSLPRVAALVRARPSRQGAEEGGHRVPQERAPLRGDGEDGDIWGTTSWGEPEPGETVESEALDVLRSE